jgi:hypothetical protein
MFSSTTPPEASVGIQRSWGHVVEEDRLCAEFEGFFEFLRSSHFHLDPLAFPALFESLREHLRQASAEGDVIVLDEDSRCQVDAVIGAAAAEDRILFQGSQSGNGLAGIQNARVRSLDRVYVSARQGGDAAEVLQEIEDDALATEQHAGIVSDDGQDLAGVCPHAVEHLRMADDLEAGLRGGARIEAGENLEEARDGAEASHDKLLAGHDRCRGAQVRVDGQVGRGVAGSLVFNQRLLQQCIDAVALPIHGFPFGKTAISF